jgi:hypothetical protein
VDTVRAAILLAKDYKVTHEDAEDSVKRVVAFGPHLLSTSLPVSESFRPLCIYCIVCVTEQLHFPRSITKKGKGRCLTLGLARKSETWKGRSAQRLYGVTSDTTDRPQLTKILTKFFRQQAESIFPRLPKQPPQQTQSGETRAHLVNRFEQVVAQTSDVFMI